MSQIAHRLDTLRGPIPSSSQSQDLSGSSQSQPSNNSNNGSQDTTATNDTDRVFTPPESDSEGSLRHASGHAPSQDSQLLRLSELAAAQQRMAGVDGGEVRCGQSRKRMADGVVKHARAHSTTSPVRMGHSRNTSTVSVASTAGSRIGELSAELKTKLSYAMVKVNNGWQGHSIDEVESLASQAASPTSSTSTLHGRRGASASPQIAIAAPRYVASNPSSAATSPTMLLPPQGRTYESFWRESNPKHPSSTSPISQAPTLAPPASIQPRQSGHTNPRRNSSARYTPTFLSQSHHASPHTPAQPSPLQNTPGQRSNRAPNIDPILFSPHQNVREQEALETLMFMSSPGNSANMKHTLPSSSSQLRNSTRTALPTSRLATGNETNSQGRKNLPTGRPQPHQLKRVEFEKSAGYGEMDANDQCGPLQARGTPRRKTLNGSVPRPSLPLPSGLSGPSRPRAILRDDDIERMIDRVAANDSSDSEGEIHIPQNRRPGGASVGA
ncbi:hypothetical protein F5X99DRAFT_390685 [Biscogniauxia marginata]|nr:hypothetical protein F5X99DRAFT_390685 [Biscogniauxia marginata]